MVLSNKQIAVDNYLRFHERKGCPGSRELPVPRSEQALAY